MTQFIYSKKGPGTIQIEMESNCVESPHPSFLKIVRGEFRVPKDEESLGAYVLVDPQLVDTDNVESYNMYVGVSPEGSVLNRISDHRREPPPKISKWMFAIIIIGYSEDSQNNQITKDEAKALEHLLYERLMRHEKIQLANKQSPKEPTILYSPTSGRDPEKLYEEASKLRDVFNRFQLFVEPTIELLETELGYSMHGKRKRAVDALSEMINDKILKVDEKLYTSPNAKKYFAEAKISPNPGYIEVTKYGKNSPEDEWEHDSERTTYPMPFLDIHAAAELVCNKKDVDGWEFWFDKRGTRLKEIRGKL